MDFCMSLHDDITSALGVKVSRPALYIYSIAGLQVDAVGGAVANVYLRQAEPMVFNP
ncbi:hypothetical protein An01g06980 [Aspergillus niger]|uniref:Uncharacterized protein n=2 Tax=Aspergillus niger TaxID=5061 RepID=A2Q982_ASPNC|nr:hypothetical protein An01g06980 [Aspergillus niger]CAK43816.1 hypothetical protein An01g06980 [Aspergillus niger]